jgi:hypothetical protein
VISTGPVWTASDPKPHAAPIAARRCSHDAAVAKIDRGEDRRVQALAAGQPSLL